MGSWSDAQISLLTDGTAIIFDRDLNVRRLGCIHSFNFVYVWGMSILCAMIPYVRRTQVSKRLP